MGQRTGQRRLSVGRDLIALRKCTRERLALEVVHPLDPVPCWGGSGRLHVSQNHSPPPGGSVGTGIGHRQ
jgi:hypothetical protein